MSLLTPFLKLFKWDTTNETDLESEFNIDKSMNENLDKLDTKAQEHENKILDIENNIENIQTKDTEQDKLIQKLQSNMIQESTEQATSIHIEDASDLPAVLKIEGNHYQEVQNSINELHLIDKEETDLGNGLSYKIEDETIILNGSVESTYALVITTQSNIVDLVKAGEEWTLSAYGENMPAENTFVRITTASNANVLQALLNSTIEEGSNSTTFTENSATVRIMLAANAVYNNSKIKIKLEKGGTKTDYDKYCKMPSIYIPSEIETVKDNIKIIQCNSNFLKKQEETEITGQGLTGTVSNDGTITLNGTTTDATYIQLTDELKITTYTNSQNFEKHTLPNGSYKFISETSGQVSTNDIHAYIYGSSSATRPNIPRISESPKKEITFEVTNNENYYAYVWIKRGTTLTDFKMKFILKRADDNSEYVQNEQKEYNLSVQQEMLQNDYFDLENNKEVHKWKKVEKTDVSEFTVTKTDNIFKFYFKVSNANNASIILSKLFKNYKNSFSNTGTVMEWNGNLNVVFKFGDCGFTEDMTVEEAKTRFQEIIDKNTSLIFYYSMTTTEELDLTEEQKEVLQQLNNLDLYKGTNNIYTDQDLALLQLDYTVDTKMYIDNKIANLKEQVNTTNELLSTTGTSAMLLDNLQNDLESEVM